MDTDTRTDIIRIIRIRKLIKYNKLRTFFIQIILNVGRLSVCVHGICDDMVNMNVEQNFLYTIFDFFFLYA